VSFDVADQLRTKQIYVYKAKYSVINKQVIVEKNVF